MNALDLGSRIERNFAAHPSLASAARFYVRYAPLPQLKARIARRVNDRFLVCPQQVRARTRFGAVLQGATDDVIPRYLYLSGRWEPNLSAWISRSLAPGDVFLDVGANIGYYTLLASSIVGSGGRVVSIEASPSIFELLSRNLRLNHSANVRAVHVAASDKEGTVSLFHGEPGNSGATSAIERAGLTFEAEVRAATLDSIVDQREAERLRIAKIDVEGLEGAVLDGMLPLLDRAPRSLEVVVEVNGTPSATDGEADALVEKMRQRGFNVYMVENDYGLTSYMDGRRPQPPVRVREPIGTRELDLVFSRTDADHL